MSGSILTEETKDHQADGSGTIVGVAVKMGATKADFDSVVAIRKHFDLHSTRLVLTIPFL